MAPEQPAVIGLSHSRRFHPFHVSGAFSVLVWDIETLLFFSPKAQGLHLPISKTKQIKGTQERLPCMCYIMFFLEHQLF